MSNKRKGHYASDDDPEWERRLTNGQGVPTQREKIEEDGRLKAANRMKERFVRLGEIMTSSPAWKALGRGGRDAYSWIERRYRKTNNGKIPMGARDLAEQMGVNKDTANRFLLRLEALGFIRPTKHGHFGDRTGARRATRWRLTEYSMDGAPPTRDYLNFGLVEASLRAREVSERDSKRLHPGRKRKFVRPKNADVTSEKCGRVRPKNSDTDPISVHGFGGSASEKFGQSTAVPGEAPEASSAAAPPAAGRPPDLTAPGNAEGKKPASTSKQKAAAPHAKRSAAASNLNGSDTWKEKLAAHEKQRKRQIAKLARKFQ